MNDTAMQAYTGKPIDLRTFSAGDVSAGADAQGRAMGSVEIELTIPEFGHAVATAWMRILASAVQRLDHATTYKRSLVKRLEEEVVGACGEMAVGKHAGRWFVPSLNTFHRTPDCFEDVEVRSTAVVPGGRLIVRDNDSDSRRYVLALVTGDRVRLCGWAYGHEAKKPEYLNAPHRQRPAWFVPQEALRPMSELGGEK